MRKLLSRDLSALLGATRAAVLEAIADGGSTTDLALRLGISPSSASEHAAILRDAGLTVSMRSRNQVRHRLTPLGAALLGIELPAEEAASDRGPRAATLVRRPRVAAAIGLARRAAVAPIAATS
ncbi:ArsR/SmtB family transcription factor [Nocardia sp. NPDC050406]|uniref:ArsR/SmtB family transcription factor n=1 Tax=Nocardia sp. NPDC050406 TaxID=3364318 RepID=UPI0037BD9D9E